MNRQRIISRRDKLRHKHKVLMDKFLARLSNKQIVKMQSYKRDIEQLRDDELKQITKDKRNWGIVKEIREITLDEFALDRFLKMVC